MKIKINFLSILFLLLSGSYTYAQNIEKGHYDVGFTTYETYDVSRSYLVNNDTISRPLLIHFWYPATGNENIERFSFKHYIDLISIREDFNKPASEITEHSFNFVNAYAGFAKQYFGLDTNTTTQQILDCPVLAHHGSTLANSKEPFPLLIYAPSNSKSAVQNHIICEDLASHGFMVISVGSAGENSIERKTDEKSILAQVNDMEFMLSYFEDSLEIKYAGLGLMAFSSGGLASSIFQMRNENVKAVFSMDGSQEYGAYNVLFKTEGFKLEKTTAPYCLLINNFENFSIYPYYNAIISDNKYMIRMPYLGHSGFVSYWKFFDVCSTPSTVNHFCNSYNSICDIALLFFDEYLQAKPAEKTKSTLNFQASEYVQPVSSNNSMIMQLCNSILSNGIDTAKVFLYENQDVFKATENEINLLSKMFIDRYIETSIPLLTFNTEMHPDSWKAHYELGSAYKQKGELSLSKESLLKAQQLNPDNSEITNLLDEVNKL